MKNFQESKDKNLHLAISLIKNKINSINLKVKNKLSNQMVISMPSFKINKANLLYS